jgi:hypothetical protein
MVFFGRLSLMRSNGVISSSYPLTVRKIRIGTNYENDIRVYDPLVDDFFLELIISDNKDINSNENDFIISSVKGLYHLFSDFFHKFSQFFSLNIFINELNVNQLI